MFDRHITRDMTIMSEVKEKGIRWFWKPYIPFGRLTLIHGEPGTGKSLLMAKLAAYATGRIPLLDRNDVIDPIHILFMTDESDLSDRPARRLKDAGADLLKVFVVNDRIPITLADNSLENMIEDYDIHAIIIDPIQAYLDSEEGFLDSDKTVPIIKKLHRVAEKSGCAILLVSPSEEVGGCCDRAWNESYGSVLDSVLEVLPEQDGGISLFHEKSRIGLEGETVLFDIENGKGLM